MARADVEARIAAAWDTLSDLLDTGQISQAQFDRVAAQEPTSDDELVRRAWAMRLTAALDHENPRAIGTDPEALRPPVRRYGPPA